MANRANQVSRKGVRLEMKEHDLQKQIFYKYGSLAWLRLWRNNTGKSVGLSLVMKAKREGIMPAFLPVTSYGTPGMPDILGIMAPTGRFIAIETKSSTGKQTQEQRLWDRMIISLGGIYILARSIEDVDNVLLRGKSNQQSELQEEAP